MSEEVVEYEATGAELVPAPVASVTLFRTDDPGEIVARATAVANALSAVLKAKKLTTKIGNREHVQVEGWTLCGSMLGVFAVTKWTRKTEDGWEARAEAVTMAGAVVGAAEAQCTRLEKEWGPKPTRGKQRDDYALRSMAQTRAISKALRIPLGFVVTLAGFDATPAEEIVAGPVEEREFDPGVDVLDGAISGEKFLERISNVLHLIDQTVDWRAVTDTELERQKWEGDGNGAEFWRRFANALAKIDVSGFPPPSDKEIINAFAWAFNGTVITLTRPVAEELDEAAMAAAEREAEAVSDAKDADDEPAPLPADTPLPGVDDDVPFGEEEKP